MTFSETAFRMVYSTSNSLHTVVVYVAPSMKGLPALVLSLSFPHAEALLVGLRG